MQTFFEEPVLHPGASLGTSGPLLTPDNTQPFVNLGGQPEFSTFVDQEPFSNPLPHFDQSPGPVPETPGLQGGRPFVNLGAGPSPLGSSGSLSPLGLSGSGHQGSFVDLGTPGGPADIFDNVPSGLGRSLSVGQNWKK